MSKRLNNAMKTFFHNMSITELRLQNADYQNSQLTYNSMLYLNILMGKQGKYTASNIADMLHVARPAVIQKINELEKQGYIIKKQSEKDKRYFYLYTTKKVIQTNNEILNMDSHIEKLLQKNYDNEQISNFLNMFVELSDIYLNYENNKKINFNSTNN